MQLAGQPAFPIRPAAGPVGPLTSTVRRGTGTNFDLCGKGRLFLTTRNARCSCGQLSLIVEGEPVRISMCHCHDCQRRTGSAFGAQAWFPREKVKINGDASQYRRTADSGNKITYHFCPSCGATVHYDFDEWDEATAVPIGAFADPCFPAPKVSVYEARKHNWVTTPPGVEHFD